MKKPVRVSWYDPYSIDEWTSLSSLEKERPMLVESFGYELHRDDDVTIITLNLDLEIGPQASCTTVIPDCCIKDYEVFDVEEKEEKRRDD